MKIKILKIGFVLVFLNTILGIILSSYSIFNFVFVDTSLVLSTLMVYVITTSDLPVGFRLGYYMAYGLTGIIRFLCAFLSVNTFENNFTFVLFAVIVAFEFVIYLLAKVLNKLF